MSISANTVMSERVLFNVVIGVCNSNTTCFIELLSSIYTVLK